MALGLVSGLLRKPGGGLRLGLGLGLMLKTRLFGLGLRVCSREIKPVRKPGSGLRPKFEAGLTLRIQSGLGLGLGSLE